jgi:cyclophilin family peptidyl-prolyl cis-trans isomerase
MKLKKMQPVAIALILVAISTSFVTDNKPKNQFVEISTIYGRIVIGLYNETPSHRDHFIRLTQEKKLDSLLFHRVIPQLVIAGGDPRSKHATKGEPLGTVDTGTGIPLELSPNFYNKRGAIGMMRDKRGPLISSENFFYIVQGRTFTVDELADIENNNNINGKRELLDHVMGSDSVNARIEDFKLRGDKEGLHAYMASLQDVLNKLYEPHMFLFPSEHAREYMNIGGAPHLDGGYTVFGEVVLGLNVLDSIANAKRDELDRPLKDIRMTVRIFNAKTQSPSNKN